MADIVFRYVEMRQAVEDIKEIATRYKNAATTFETDFLAAIKDWEGESKEKLQQFVSGSVMDYTREAIPQLLEALASLLSANADAMEKADHDIAENIPTTM